ncbi:MAG: RecX family transcriptional regulator, partial [Bacteroidales bacterium]|nr:RecX family transcriptional regulator [Bacteroidales bacterium]
LPKESIDQIIQQLIDENFLNEERFTENFIRGKFKIKQWGRNKIRQHLILKGIDNQTICQHLKSDISDTDYQNTLKNEIEKYLNLQPIETENDSAKFFRHFISKGFEYDLIKQTLNIIK